MTKLLIGIAAITALVFGGVVPAHAAVYYAWGMYTPQYRMKPYGLNPTWTTPMEQARNQWNNASAKINVTLNSSANAKAVVVNYPNETWLGRYVPVLDTSFTIEINQPKISADPPFATSLRSNFAHELGHSFKLGDRSTGNNSVMSYNRNRHSVYGPTSADITEANNNYPNY